VALEGGGALGLAHIGVLQWFEDHHIPIDYIAGTSMGGLVGGLYATGKSPAELKALVEKQDWDAIIDGQTSYQDLSFRHKEDQRALPNRVEFGLRKGFSLPSGLNSGQGVSLLIDRETLAYTHNGSFDDFPIPFRCVATNLVTGKTVVFDHGSIAQALRSTMSIPGVFAPVRDGNAVYVDGGLLGNLPTDVGRKMGADLVVNVDLKDFDAIDYKKAGTIIDRGSQAAAGKANILAPYTLDDASWNAYLSQRKERVKSEVPAPQFVEVRGTGPKASQEVERFLQPLQGKPIDIPVMEDKFNQLTGIGNFDSFDYWLGERNSQTGLIVTVHEKSHEPPSLQLGFEADGSEAKDVTFTYAGRLTFQNVVGY